MHSTPQAPVQITASPRPSSLLDLFLSFTFMALQGFGGVLTVAQRMLCEQKKWLTQKEFAEDWAVSQVLPGPNIVNLSIMLGDRYFGLRGVVVAISGLFLVPTILVLVLGAIYNHYSDFAYISAAVKGMGAVAAGMIGAAGLKIFVNIKTSPTGKIGFALAAIASFVLVALLRKPLIFAVLFIGLPSIFWTYWRLYKKAQPSAKEAA
jgi:chromate transporter